MTRKITDDILNIRIGAIYSFAARRGLDRGTVVALLMNKACFSEAQAKTLCGHWFTTQKFRQHERAA